MKASNFGELLLYERLPIFDHRSLIAAGGSIILGLLERIRHKIFVAPRHLAIVLSARLAIVTDPHLIRRIRVYTRQRVGDFVSAAPTVDFAKAAIDNLRMANQAAHY